MILTLLERILSDRKFRVGLKSSEWARKPNETSPKWSPATLGSLSHSFQCLHSGYFENNLKKMYLCWRCWISDTGTIVWRTRGDNSILDKDFVKLKRYFDKLRLILNASITVAITFHLNNREARWSLQLSVNNVTITNDECLHYL